MDCDDAQPLQNHALGIRGKHQLVAGGKVLDEMPQALNVIASLVVVAVSAGGHQVADMVDVLIDGLVASCPANLPHGTLWLGMVNLHLPESDLPATVGTVTIIFLVYSQPYFLTDIHFIYSLTTSINSSTERTILY